MTTSTEQRKTLSSLLDGALGTADAASIRKAIASAGDANLEARRIGNRLLLRETKANLNRKDVLSKVLKDICEVCEGVTAIAERVLRNSSHRSSSLLVGKAKDKAMTCDDLLCKIEDWRSTSAVPNTRMGNLSGSTTGKRKASNTDIPTTLGPKKKIFNGVSKDTLHMGRDVLTVTSRKSKNEIATPEMPSNSKMKSRTAIPNYKFLGKRSARENIFDKALKAKLEFARREAELAEEAAKGADGNVGITRCARCMKRYERGENSKTECIWHPGVVVSVGKSEYKFWTCCKNAGQTDGCKASKHVEVVILAEEVERQNALKVYMQVSSAGAMAPKKPSAPKIMIL